MSSSDSEVIPALKHFTPSESNLRIRIGDISKSPGVKADLWKERPGILMASTEHDDNHILVKRSARQFDSIVENIRTKRKRLLYQRYNLFRQRKLKESRQGTTIPFHERNFDKGSAKPTIHSLTRVTNDEHSQKFVGLAKGSSNQQSSLTKKINKNDKAPRHNKDTQRQQTIVYRSNEPTRYDKVYGDDGATALRKTITSKTTESVNVQKDKPKKVITERLKRWRRLRRLEKVKKGKPKKMVTERLKCWRRLRDMRMNRTLVSKQPVRNNGFQTTSTPQSLYTIRYTKLNHGPWQTLKRSDTNIRPPTSQKPKMIYGPNVGMRYKLGSVQITHRMGEGMPQSKTEDLEKGQKYKQQKMLKERLKRRRLRDKRTSTTLNPKRTIKDGANREKKDFQSTTSPVLSTTRYTQLEHGSRQKTESSETNTRPLQTLHGDSTTTNERYLSEMTTKDPFLDPTQAFDYLTSFESTKKPKRWPVRLVLDEEDAQQITKVSTHEEVSLLPTHLFQNTGVTAAEKTSSDSVIQHELTTENPKKKSKTRKRGKGNKKRRKRRKKNKEYWRQRRLEKRKRRLGKHSNSKHLLTTISTSTSTPFSSSTEFYQDTAVPINENKTSIIDDPFELNNGTDNISSSSSSYETTSYSETTTDASYFTGQNFSHLSLYNDTTIVDNNELSTESLDLNATKEIDTRQSWLEGNHSFNQLKTDKTTSESYASVHTAATEPSLQTKQSNIIQSHNSSLQIEFPENLVNVSDSRQPSSHSSSNLSNAKVTQKTTPALKTNKVPSKISHHTRSSTLPATHQPSYSSDYWTFLTSSTSEANTLQHTTFPNNDPSTSTTASPHSSRSRSSLSKWRQWALRRRNNRKTTSKKPRGWRSRNKKYNSKNNRRRGSVAGALVVVNMDNQQTGPQTQAPTTKGPFIGHKTAYDFLSGQRYIPRGAQRSENRRESVELNSVMAENMCEVFDKHFVQTGIGGKCV